jgi:hypothetical protein
MNGLLDMGGGMRQQMGNQQIGGLLGAANQGGSKSSEGLRMAMMLSQSPTPETVQMVIETAKKSGNPQAGQLAELLGQFNSPKEIKQFADQILQQIRG